MNPLEDPSLPFRLRMVEEQIRRRGITNPRVLQAFSKVPRHIFVPGASLEDAYGDHPLPIGFGQTISQPYIVALMTELLDPQPQQHILEIGTGSGYQAAILAELGCRVTTIEYRAGLARRARTILPSLGYPSIEIIHGDGSRGLPEHAPYEGIIITAGAPQVPPPLLDQLADGGRLVAPIGDRWGQELITWQRNGENFNFTHGISVAFVPLRGEYGWQQGSWE